jgi:hypothetical protein
MSSAHRWQFSSFKIIKFRNNNRPWLDAGVSLQRLRFNPSAIHVGFMVKKWHWSRCLSKYFRFLLPIIILPMLCINSSSPLRFKTACYHNLLIKPHNILLVANFPLDVPYLPEWKTLNLRWHNRHLKTCVANASPSWHLSEGIRRKSNQDKSGTSTLPVLFGWYSW